MKIKHDNVSSSMKKIDQMEIGQVFFDSVCEEYCMVLSDEHVAVIAVLNPSCYNRVGALYCFDDLDLLGECFVVDDARLLTSHRPGKI